MTKATTSTEDPSIWLHLGDLPGYTGWARPFETLAGSFGPPSFWPSNASWVVGKNATIRVHCIPSIAQTSRHQDHFCQHGGSLFYLRAYGPAVLPGRVMDYGNGTYDISFFPMDAGIYHLEVVLAFSSPPPFTAFPLSLDRKEEPAYEGYPLPGFPVVVDVQPESIPTSVVMKARDCQSADFFWIGNARGPHPTENGRWIVQDKATSATGTKSSRSSKQGGGVSMGGYQKGLNSVGVRMKYAPRHCRLLPLNRAIDKLGCASGHNIHVIYIGDSNLRLQKNTFDSFWKTVSSKAAANNDSGLPHIETSLISLHGGLHQTLPNVSLALRGILHNATSTDSKKTATAHMILFNSGLHDISRRCAMPNGHELLSMNLSCTQDYKNSFRALLSLVSQFPADLKVLQTTTAGWPKYGNFGFAWPPTHPQTLPRDPNFVDHFNCVMLQEVVNARTGTPRAAGSFGNSNSAISVMDAFWLTLSRPDHREVDKTNAIGKHLVHPGPEVLNALTRQWITMIIESLCGGASV
ncbi:expressed unknown protein [Seminavis robusta]|uniref:Uncharacterized protein n=1 Tax=Seminavis robusta TaxID=568900 RepID=A0A9N8H9R8_9STRA|nr:expressed unknown protein [Seminavis robusta]|eukprot:Sro265_g102900.1 n/a (522) ;mRNA; f:65639-67204